MTGSGWSYLSKVVGELVVVLESSLVFALQGLERAVAKSQVVAGPEGS